MIETAGFTRERSTSPTRGGVTWREAVSSTAMPLELLEFPADDLARARRFWEILLDVSLDERREGEGQGLQTHDDRPSLGLHDRGRGPGDRFSLPYFRVPGLAQPLERVVELEGRSSTRASAGRSAATPRAARSVSRRSEGVLRATRGRLVTPRAKAAAPYSDETTIGLRHAAFRRRTGVQTRPPARRGS